MKDDHRIAVSKDITFALAKRKPKWIYGTYLHQLDDLPQVGLLDVLLAHLVELPCTGIAEFEPRTSLNAFFSQLQLKRP